MDEISPIKPRKIPFKCVVCNGFGTVKHGEFVCQGCGGKGWVVVDQEDTETQGDKYAQPTDK